jgi:predicted phage baseplate assembly protein
MSFTAAYRVGNGTAGNVGAEAISRLVLKKTRLGGVSVALRNPLPAQGGTDPEPLAEAKLFAPHAFRKRIERAVVSGDYEDIAERNQKIQMASAALAWTGSWYEADVSIDPVGREDADTRLLADIERDLSRFRRMGHDLAVVRAKYVPIVLRLDVCARPFYERAHVKAALLAAFGTRVLPGGRRGFFHPDNLTFGEGIYMSQIIAAAQRVTGVECVEVVEFHRLFEAPNREIENGVLPLSPSEIPQLDNDPNYPERGVLDIRMRGGL